MDRPWLTQYPPGVPTRIDIDACASLKDLLASRCGRFADLPAYFIGVRCPLEVLEARETMRRDRTLGQAKAQFHLVHAHAVYDLEVDTALLTPQQCAAQIITRLVDPPWAFKRLTAV